MRTCRVCGKEKSLSDYHKKSSFQDGIDNRCKDCTNEYNRKYHHKNIKHQNAGQRKRRLKPESREYQKKYFKELKEENPEVFNKRQLKAVKKFQANNREKTRAQYTLNNNLRYGRVKKTVCEICNSDKVEAHHDDYSKPLDVRWLCRTHHAEHHRRIRDEVR